MRTSQRGTMAQHHQLTDSLRTFVSGRLKQLRQGRSFKGNYFKPLYLCSLTKPLPTRCSATEPSLSRANQSILSICFRSFHWFGAWSSTLWGLFSATPLCDLVLQKRKGHIAQSTPRLSNFNDHRKQPVGGTGRINPLKITSSQSQSLRCSVDLMDSHVFQTFTGWNPPQDLGPSIITIKKSAEMFMTQGLLQTRLHSCLCTCIHFSIITSSDQHKTHLALTVVSLCFQPPQVANEIMEEIGMQTFLEPTNTSQS